MELKQQVLIYAISTIHFKYKLDHYGIETHILCIKYNSLVGYKLDHYGIETPRCYN